MIKWDRFFHNLSLLTSVRILDIDLTPESEGKVLMLYVERKGKLNKEHLLTQTSRTLRISEIYMRSNTKRIVNSGYPLTL